MDRLRRFILESAFTEDFSKAVYNALGIFEAVNINKMFLIQAAGSPDAFREVKNKVNTVWADAHMDGIVRGGNVIQKLFNFLYLMEIRQPGFVNSELMTKIHDVAIHGSLEQKFLSKVDSDTPPDKAMAILDEAKSSAAQAAKAYPDLTDEEEKIWNRVKVYHEFPDGFRWVYAVDSSGKITSYIPSRVTGKTMNHCGNSPRAGSDDQYWELRDARGKAYLTVILNRDGEIEESKSWGNQVSKYRQQILPYVKWFLKDKQVTGVGPRYDTGYATHMNFGVKDFIGDDPEFIDYVLENKDSLIGNAESRILFWQTAIKEGFVTVEDLKQAYMSGITRSAFFKEIPGLSQYSDSAKFKIRDGQYDPPDSLFGANSFAVLCAACSGNPFSEAELIDLISTKKLKLEVFANYSIKLLTPEIQEAFVRADGHNLDTLIDISNQVAAFKVSPTLWRALMPTEEEISHIGDMPDAKNEELLDRCARLMRMVGDANPPSKMAGVAQELMTNEPFLTYVYAIIVMSPDDFSDTFIRHRYSLNPISFYEMLSNMLSKYSDMPLPAGYAKMHASLLASFFGRYPESFERNDYDMQTYHLRWETILSSDNSIGKPRNDALLSQYTDSMISTMLRSNGLDDKYERIKSHVGMLCQAFTCERIAAIGAGMGIKQNVATIGAMATTMPKTTELGELARSVVYDYFYSKRPNVDCYIWEDDSGTGYLHNPIHIIVFDLLIHWDAMIRLLDWDDERTYKAMKRIVCNFRNYELDVPKDELERVLVYFVNEMSEPGHMKYTSEIWRYRIYNGSFPRELMTLVLKYGIENEKISSFFRAMVDVDWENDGGSDYVGAWSIYTIPFEEWEDEYSKHGFDFVNGYILQVPADTMYENEFIPNFICDKLLHKAWGGIQELIQKVQGTRRKGCLAKTISKRIIDDTFPLDGPDGERLFNILYDNRMINAEAYRAVMGRREDRGAVAVDNLETVLNVNKAFSSIQRMDTLPELMAATFTYLVDTLYANMGDGRYRWKVDENAHEEAYMVGALSAKLASKATVGMVPKAIKKLYDDGIVDKIRDFPAANRAACDTPNKPKSKITCGAIRDLNDAVYALDRVKESAFAAANKPAKAPRRKKSVAPDQ